MTHFRHKPFYLLLFLAFSVIFHGSLESSESNSNSPAQLLLKQLKSLGTFESAYQQHVFNETGEQIESAQGRFYLGDNKAFRNDIHQPEKSRVISDGNSLWLIDDELEQVSISLLSSYLEDSPLALLLDKSESALKDYQVKEIAESAPNTSIFHLDAEESYNAIKAIRIAFNKNNVTYIEIDEQRGRKIRVTFSSIQALKGNQVFKADYPSDYDVVDETQ